MKKDLEWLKGEFERVKQQSTQKEPRDDFWFGIQVGWDVAERTLNSLSKKLDTKEQPELPVIPGYVAGWIEYLKEFDKKGLPKPRLHKTEELVSKGLKIDRAQTWIRLNYKKYCTAYAIGYAVEEKRYYVLDNNKRTMLGRNMVGATIETDRYNVGELMGLEIKEHQFTEQEIKDYDERYWAFAKEVKE